jgi:THO complex subunit 6
VRIWKWRDIAAALANASRGPSVEIKPAHVTRLEREALGFRGALSPFSEINGVAVSREAARAFLAGGDGAAHELDLSSLSFVRRFTGHADYLHSVQYLSHSRELVTGSEDGTIGIWDARQAKRVELLQPSSSPSSSTSGSDAWVGSVAVDASETWLAAGGGSKKRARGGGFLGVWHLPSRVPVHVTPTPSDVHDVAFHRTELLSVGNDASLRQWNRSSGTLLATAHSSVPAGRFCVVDSVSDVIAVGGAAPSIDIYAMPGVVSFSLVVQDDL